MAQRQPFEEQPSPSSRRKPSPPPSSLSPSRPSYGMTKQDDDDDDDDRLPGDYPLLGGGVDMMHQRGGVHSFQSSTITAPGTSLPHHPPQRLPSKNAWLATFSSMAESHITHHQHHHHHQHPHTTTISDIGVVTSSIRPSLSPNDESMSGSEQSTEAVYYWTSERKDLRLLARWYFSSLGKYVYLPMSWLLFETML